MADPGSQTNMAHCHVVPQWDSPTACNPFACTRLPGCHSLTDRCVLHFLCRCPEEAGHATSANHVLARGWLVPAWFAPLKRVRQVRSSPPAAPHLILPRGGSHLQLTRPSGLCSADVLMAAGHRTTRVEGAAPVRILSLYTLRKGAVTPWACR